MWEVEVKWRNNNYGGGSESETTTVVNVSNLKSYNKLILRYSPVYIRRSGRTPRGVKKKRTHSSSYQLILSLINSTCISIPSNKT